MSGSVRTAVDGLVRAQHSARADGMDDVIRIVEHAKNRRELLIALGVARDLSTRIRKLAGESSP
jgi:hypothetical protein